MLKDKKVLAGGAVLLLALFWFYIKPNYMDAKAIIPPTAEEIAAAYKPTIVLGKPADAKLAAAWTGLKMNLSASADSPHYALAVIALEFDDPKHSYVGIKAPAALDAKNAAFADELSPEMHKILDATTGVVGSKTVEQVTKPGGRDELATDLVAAINGTLKDHKVEKVYFETFITQ